MPYSGSLLDLLSQLFVLIIVYLASSLPATHESVVELADCEYPEDWKYDVENECYRKNENENGFVGQEEFSLLTQKPEQVLFEALVNTADLGALAVCGGGFAGGFFEIGDVVIDFDKYRDVFDVYP